MSQSAPARILKTPTRSLVGARAVARALGADAIAPSGLEVRGSVTVGFVAYGSREDRGAAMRGARALGVPCWFVVDGPFRPSGAAFGRVPFSFRILDAHLDPSTTRFEAIGRALRGTVDASERSERAVARFREAGISVDERARPSRRIEPCDVAVFADAPSGDLAHDTSRLDAMLEHALETSNGAILVRTAPHRIPTKRARDARVRVVPVDVSAPSVFAAAERIVVDSSDVGFEALLHGKPVTTFTQTYYTGPSLARPPTEVPRSASSRARSELAAAAWLVDTYYVDPETTDACTLERALDHLALQRRYVEHAEDAYVAIGFSPWKRAFLGPFLGAPPNALTYRRRPKPTAGGVTAVVWGVKLDATLPPSSRVTRMEDGFLRSVGLGSDFHLPASLVADTRGIYFDPSRPSDLEDILANDEFGALEIGRAQSLRERIVALNVSKYNVGSASTLALPEAAKGRPVVLVIGQVEDDASIRLGCVDVRTNADLLREARRARPEAFIVWKPHPDVTSGNREGAVPPSLTSTLADLVVTSVGVGGCLSVVDEVHTMTSLVGFEALLRGLRVVVYGQPFYAGWGLTTDRHPHPRRTRMRTLDELVAATLIRYPRYVHPTSGELTTPEAIVTYLATARMRVTRDSMGERWTSLTRALAAVLGVGGSRGR